jgi:hypothetical protein
MTTLNDIIGLTIVGYRYGKAPECGRSWNTRENHFEAGVSMAKVGYCKEFGSFAADACMEYGKHYYIGRVIDTGSDNEICLEDVQEITEEQYQALLPTMIDASNKIVDYYADQELRLLNAGYHIGKDENDIEKFRLTYKKNNTTMKKYTVFYKGSDEYRNMGYSFEAESDEEALEFCKHKFSVSTDDMTIIENDTDYCSTTGRLVYNRGAFVTTITQN